MPHLECVRSNDLDLSLMFDGPLHEESLAFRVVHIGEVLRDFIGVDQGLARDESLNGEGDWRWVGVGVETTCCN